MRINLNQLRSFFFAARDKSITKAAQSLFVTQPAVTMQIKSLESDLDLKLFTRHGKGFDLTDAGRVLFGYAERIFEIVEEMEYVLKGHADLSHGSLVIGTTRSFARHLMPRLLSRFQEQYPGVKVYLKVGSSTKIANRVMAYEYHLGVIGRIPFRSKLSVVPFSREEFCLVVPTSHRFATQKAVGFSDLAHEPIIIREDGSGSRYAILSMLSSHGIKPSVLLEAESVEFIKEYIIQGRGVSFLYKPEIRLEAQLGLLKPLTLTEGSIMVQTDVIFPKEVDLNPATKAFLRLFDQMPENSGDTINFQKTNFRKKYQEFRQHERTGRPLGSDLRIDKLEVLLEKQLRNRKTAPKGQWEERGNQKFSIVSPEFF